MRAVLLFLIAIVPNVSSSTTKSQVTTTVATGKPTQQQYIYERGNDKKGCVKGTRVTTLDECKVASTFFKTKTGRTPPVIGGKSLADAPSGCYYYSGGDEMHFNVGHNDLKVFYDGDEPICKVAGTTTTEKTTPTTTTTISKRINDACKDQNWQGDGNCDPGNNNAGCKWDKLIRRGSSGAISDCCKGPAAMKHCKDPNLCKCLDPDFKGEIPTAPKQTTATVTPAPTKKTSTPTPAPATKTTTPAPTKKVTASAETKVTMAKKTSGPAKKTEAASLTTKVVKEVKDASSRLPSTLWTAIICCALIFAAC